MKTRGIAMLLAVALIFALPCAAGAEIVGQTADGFIHRYTADNGQEIYFFSTSQETIVETGEDVNFDGYPDLAVVTALGASNAYYEFYLWNGSEYEYAQRATDDIINYYLAEGKYLVSKSNDGSAGLLFHAQICVWDGNVLRTVRRMVSEEETVTSWDDSTMTTTLYLDRLHVCLQAHDGASGDVVTLWEKTYSPLPDDPDVFDEFMSHLWDGLAD